MDKPDSKKRRDVLAEVANTIEWLITALALAFVFRAFIMEAFRIPTGSMADTLMGAHFRLRCTQCGYGYDYGLGNFRLPRDEMPQEDLRPRPSQCPVCGYTQPTGGSMRASNGDRILVLKSIYQFVEPRQWDVVVFRNPLDPSENYIKRLVARPGEKIEIIDGDIYINGSISRKPHAIQDELWTPLYDNDYQPARPGEPYFDRHAWQQPFRNVEGSAWVTEDASHPTVFRLDSPAEQKHTLVYNSAVANDFRAAYAYNDGVDHDFMPYCSDLMIRFWVREEEAEGCIGASLSKYDTTYRAWVDTSGRMVMTRTSADGESVLASLDIPMRDAGAITAVRFTNVDHILVFEFGDQKISADLGRGPDDAGPRKPGVQPRVAIFGAGKLELSHVAVFRDIHYTERSPHSNSPARASEGNALQLEADQFFVLGDNSPRSEDSRWWSRPGKGNYGRTYPEGIVPRDYLVGKALFVYWAAGFRPFVNSRFAVVPNVGQMRFIYGGSDKVN